MAPTRNPPDPPEPPHPPDVPAILGREDVPPELWLVAGRVPLWMWRPLLEELETFRVKSANGRIRLDLLESFGVAKDAEIQSFRTVRRPRPRG